MCAAPQLYSTWLPPAKPEAVESAEERTNVNKGPNVVEEARKEIATPATADAMNKFAFTKYIYHGKRLPNIDKKVLRGLKKAVPIIYAPNALDGQNRKMGHQVTSS